MMELRGKENKPEIKSEPGVSVEESVGRRSAREKKPVSYVQEDGESDNDDKLKKKKSPAKSRKRPRPSLSQSSSSGDDDSSDENEYERMRQKNIQERLELVRSLGLTTLKEELSTAPEDEEVKSTEKKSKTRKEKRKWKKIKPPMPREKSKRVKILEKERTDKVLLNIKSEPCIDSSSLDLVYSTLDLLRVKIEQEESRKPSGPLPMISLKISQSNDEQEEENDDEAASKCKDFISLLRPFLVHKGDESKLSTCSLNTFKNIASHLKLTEDMVAKTNTARITSLAIHPGEEKLLIAAGSLSGDLGLWDVHNPDEEKCVEVLGPHTNQVNCTSFDVYGPAKIFTTSHDGTVRRGDLMKMIFEEIWASDQTETDWHTTWHDQLEPHVIVVSHGTGRVVFIDTRTPLAPVGWFDCHERSCRTVQQHPLDGRYFVTSSKLGQVRIWDRRLLGNMNAKPVWDLVHPKGLTSAFFSCKGNLLLTTCNDDRLRVYHTANLPGSSKPKVVTNIKHFNHTGRWTSVFKAVWHPQREDVFMIGSMDQQRKIQLYGIHGQPVCNLMSENLATISAVNAWHPSLPIIAGANSSGRVHVFQ